MLNPFVRLFKMELISIIINSRQFLKRIHTHRTSGLGKAWCTLFKYNLNIKHERMYIYKHIIYCIYMYKHILFLSIKPCQ